MEFGRNRFKINRKASQKNTMIPVPIPANEVERLASLHRMQILSTPGEAAFDKITYVARHILGFRI